MSINLSPADQQALAGHDVGFLVGEAAIDGTPVVATVDRLGDPAVVTYLGVKEDGEVLYGRYSVAQAAIGDAHQVSDYLAGAAQGRPFPLKLSEAFDWFGARDGVARFGDHFANSFHLRHPGSEVPDDMLYATAEGNLMAAGAPEMAEKLNRDALAALACIQEFDLTPYNFYAAPGGRGEVRRQAAAVYPLLAADLTTSAPIKMAIDLRKPLQGVLESAYGMDEAGNPYLTKALQRRLQNQPYPDYGIPTRVLVQTLGQMPPDWFPRSPEDWQAFCMLTHTGFRDFAREIQARPDKLCPGANGKWAEVRARVAKSAASTLPPEDLSDEEKRKWKPVGDESLDGINGAFVNAMDVIESFRDLVVLPAAASAVEGDDDIPLGPEQRQLAFDAAARILYGGKSLTAIMELQRHWHTQAANIVAATGAEEEKAVTRGVQKEVAKDGWAPLCDVWMAPNGVTVMPLTDPRELKDEGAGGLGQPGPDSNGIMGLGHCVGGYSTQCKNGQSHIVSFRVYNPDGTFRRLSTAEFRAPKPDSDKLESRQHYGRQNGAPPKEGKEAFDWFVSEVEARRIPLNRDGIMSFLSGKPVITDEIQRRAGYDRKDREIVQRVLDAWKLYLPKKFRDADVDAFRESPEMEALVESLAPRYSHAMKF